MKKTIQQKERSISYVISEAISGDCASLCEDHRSIDDYLDDIHYKASLCDDHRSIDDY